MSLKQSTITLECGRNEVETKKMESFPGLFFHWGSERLCLSSALATCYKLLLECIPNSTQGTLPQISQKILCCVSYWLWTCVGGLKPTNTLKSLHWAVAHKLEEYSSLTLKLNHASQARFIDWNDHFKYWFDLIKSHYYPNTKWNCFFQTIKLRWQFCINFNVYSCVKSLVENQSGGPNYIECPKCNTASVT